MLYQKSFIKLNTKQIIDIAKMNPKTVLVGKNPRLIDEQQTVPDIWNQVKNSLDENYSFGQFILTGSSTPADKTQIYHCVLGGEIRHYRDNAGLECDAVIHLPNGKWAAIEIKLGGEDLINEGAKSLKLLNNKITEKSDEKAPSFMIILTAFGPMYRRNDGIYVIPINCLKP